jgi:hypothetical protein
MGCIGHGPMFVFVNIKNRPRCMKVRSLQQAEAAGSFTLGMSSASGSRRPHGDQPWVVPAHYKRPGPLD